MHVHRTCQRKTDNRKQTFKPSIRTQNADILIPFFYNDLTEMLNEKNTIILPRDGNSRLMPPALQFCKQEKEAARSLSCSFRVCNKFVEK
jgi:hypothetical protein